HLFEGRWPCPFCGAELAVREHGWAFTECAAAHPSEEPAFCDECDESWDPFDASALVRAASQVDRDVRAWLDAYATVTNALLEHIVADRLVETCFGTFSTHEYASYQGRNPATGGIVEVPPKRLRGLAVAPTFEAHVLEGILRVRPLTMADLDDEEVL